MNPPCGSIVTNVLPFPEELTIRKTAQFACTELFRPQRAPSDHSTECRPFLSAPSAVYTWLWPPLEGRLGIDAALLFGDCHFQFRLCQFELLCDLSALGRVAAIQLAAQFLDVVFQCNRHCRHLLE